MVLLTDITYLPYSGTFAYLSTIQDAFTKQILVHVEEMLVAVHSFDESAWYALMDYVMVFGRDDVKFTFKNGTEISSLLI